MLSKNQNLQKRTYQRESTGNTQRCLLWHWWLHCGLVTALQQGCLGCNQAAPSNSEVCSHQDSPESLPSMAHTCTRRTLRPGRRIQDSSQCWAPHCLTTKHRHAGTLLALGQRRWVLVLLSEFPALLQFPPCQHSPLRSASPFGGNHTSLRSPLHTPCRSLPAFRNCTAIALDHFIYWASRRSQAFTFFPTPSSCTPRRTPPQGNLCFSSRPWPPSKTQNRAVQIRTEGTYKAHFYPTYLPYWGRQCETPKTEVSSK